MRAHEITVCCAACQARVGDEGVRFVTARRTARAETLTWEFYPNYRDSEVGIAKVATRRFLDHYNVNAADIDEAALRTLENGLTEWLRTGKMSPTPPPLDPRRRAVLDESAPAASVTETTTGEVAIEKFDAPVRCPDPGCGHTMRLRVTTLARKCDEAVAAGRTKVFV